MPPPFETHPALLDEEKLLQQCDIRRTRASGPGGQHRNKVDTAIVITHLETGVVGQSTEHRSQDRNRREAIQRLRINLAIQVRGFQSVDVGEFKIPEHWQRYRNETKIVVSIDNKDYPILLTVVLDLLECCQFELPQVSKRLQVSTSQLIKFLKREPKAYRWFNQQRRLLGMVTFK